MGLAGLALSTASLLPVAAVFFPTSTGVNVYSLLSGKKQATLQAHFGAVSCCVASPEGDRVFSGGDDKTINVWTPPPCGVVRPAPLEPIAKPLAAGGAASSSQVEQDGDAWSDEEGEQEGEAAQPWKRRRRTGS